MRIGRRLSLSTHAPITNPKSKAGRTPAAVSADIWTGVASRVRIAVNWSAPNTEPVTDMVCTDHSFRKSTFRHRLLSTLGSAWFRRAALALHEFSPFLLTVHSESAGEESGLSRTTVETSSTRYFAALSMDIARPWRLPAL